MPADGQTWVMSHLRDQMASEPVLLAAWLHVRSSSDGAEPTAAVLRFEGAIARNLARLAAEIRTGMWMPTRGTRVGIPKKSGGTRNLTVPSVRDRVAERAIMLAIEPLIDEVLQPWSFAYRRGVSARDAVDALIECRNDGFTHALRTDVRDCFDEIPHDPLLRRVADVVRDDAAVELVARAVVHRGNAGRGVAQGSPLSPVLANLYLDVADQQILATGHVPIRYADDVAVPMWDREDHEAIARLVADAYASIGLNVSEAKTRVGTFSDGVDFLGERVCDTADSRGVEVHRPGDATVYVSTTGALLRSKGDRFRVEREGERTVSLPYTRTRQVVIIGRVGLTTPFLQQAMRRGIEIVFLSDSGSYFGRLDGELGSNPFVREAQYVKMREDDFGLEIGRRFVLAKVLNQRRLLLRLARRAGRQVFADGVRTVDSSRTAIERARCREELMGAEGMAARSYFSALGRLLGDEWGFEGRRRRPPPDPVNSMLSFGYSILVQEVISAIHAAGLDPYASFLHRPRVGRPSLALDLVEEFRPCIVDSVVIRLVRIGAVTPDDFEIADGPPRSCRLQAPARRLLLDALETRMLTVFTHANARRRMSWRQAVGWQCHEVVRVLGESGASYRPLFWR